MPIPDYMVPARRLLTVVHRPDGEHPDRTVCGERMDLVDLWVPWPYEAGRDRLCRLCVGASNITVEDVPLR